MIQLLVHVITSIIEKKKNGCNLFGEYKKGLEKMWREPPERKERCAGHSRQDQKIR